MCVKHHRRCAIYAVKVDLLGVRLSLTGGGGHMKGGCGGTFSNSVQSAKLNYKFP